MRTRILPFKRRMLLLACLSLSAVWFDRAATGLRSVRIQTVLDRELAFVLHLDFIDVVGVSLKVDLSAFVAVFLLRWRLED